MGRRRMCDRCDTEIGNDGYCLCTILESAKELNMSDGISHGYRESHPIKEQESCTPIIPEEAIKMSKELKDGGSRKTYSTGAQKEDPAQTEGKGAYHLLPPTAINRVAEIWRKGAMKYTARNWEKGLPLSRFIDSGLRHAFQYLEGKEDEDHLAQAAWNFLACLHTEEMIKRGILPEELNDLPGYGGPDMENYRKPGPGMEK